MDKNILFETASRLKQVSNKAADEYLLKTEYLVNLMNTKMQNREDIEDLVGKRNLDMMKDNHANHARFIGSILKNKNADVLVETILWVFRAYRSHGFHTNYWAAQLNSWIEILKKELTQEAYSEIYPYYEWMQVNIPIFVVVSDEKLEAPNSMH
jgi:hypothetical protein